MVDGFEKLTLSDYKWSTFKEVKQRVTNIASGLVDFAGIKPGDKVVIYADTKMVWSHLTSPHLNPRLCCAVLCCADFSDFSDRGGVLCCARVM